MKINGKELTVKPLGAVQIIRMFTQGARAQYMEDAKALASELEGKERATYMAEMHRGLRSLTETDLLLWGQSPEGAALMISKATGLSKTEAMELLETAEKDVLDELMSIINPDAGGDDEKVVAFQRATEAVLSARFMSDKEAMVEAVEECMSTLRSVSLLEEPPEKK